MGIVTYFGGDTVIQAPATVLTPTIPTSGPYTDWLLIPGAMVWNDVEETDYTVGYFSFVLNMFTVDGSGKVPTQSGYTPTYTTLAAGDGLGWDGVMKDTTMNGSAYLSASTLLVSPTNRSAVQSTKSYFDFIMTTYTGPMMALDVSWDYYDANNSHYSYYDYMFYIRAANY